MMGGDYYDDSGDIPMGIGENCNIEGAILDKNVRIGRDVCIRPFPPGTEIDNETYTVRDGIVVIPKRMILPSGTRIEP